MPVILVRNPENAATNKICHYVTGADNNGGVTFSENPADAKLFVDAAAATAFASGKNVHGAVQQTVSGLIHKGKKSSNE